jgi:Short C-terminal domain
VARVELDREWLVKGAGDVEAAVERAAGLEGLKATRGPNGIELRGGSQLKLRLSGSLFARDDYLPRSGLFYRSAVPGNPDVERLTLHLEETLGFDLMGPVMKHKYERVLDGAASAIEAAITRTVASVETASGASAAPAPAADEPAPTAPDEPAPTASDDPAPAAPEQRSTADELEHLADLHTRGVLSDAEFEAAKAKLLE